MQIILEVDENNFKENVVNNISDSLDLSEEEKDELRKADSFEHVIPVTKTYLTDALSKVLKEELSNAEVMVASEFVGMMMNDFSFTFSNQPYNKEEI